MNVEELKTNIKRFFSNPNTLTFFMVIALIVVIYFVYTYLVNRAISPVNLPYANQLITSRTEIKNDMIGTVKISGSFATSSGGGLIQQKRMILNKYVKQGYQIPQNSFFYQEAIVDEQENDKGIAYDIPSGYTVYLLNADFHSTYGCSIMPGNYVDIYFKAIDPSTHLIINELFIESIQVTRVVDKNGVDVFSYSDSEEKCNPKYIHLVVPIEYGKLLESTKLIPNANIELIPVPRNAGYSENPGETRIANEAVEQFIRSKVVWTED